MKIGELFVEIGAKLDNFNKGMSDVDRALKKVGDKFARVGKKLTIGLTLPLAAAGGATIKLAMDAVESEELFEVSMKGMAGAARKWSEKLRDELGLNSYEVRKNIAVFNAMLNSMGLSEEAAYQMAKGLTQLAYDMASLYNLPTEQAFLKLQSGISGEIEPLKRLGILVNENTIKHWALTNGLIKQGQVLTEQQKVQARYNVILEQTHIAHGNLAKTIDSPANKLRILKSRITELGIEIGTKLLPIFEKILSGVEKAVTWFSNLSEGTKTLALKFAALAAAIGPAIFVLGKFMKTVAALNAVGTLGSVIKLAGAIGILAGAFYLVKKGVDANREANRRLQKQYDDQWRKTQRVVRGTLDLAKADKGLAKELDNLRKKHKLNNEELTEFILRGKAGKDLTKRFAAALNAATKEYIKQEKEIKKTESATENLSDEIESLAKDIYAKLTGAITDGNEALKTSVKLLETEVHPALKETFGPITQQLLLDHAQGLVEIKEELTNLSAIYPEKLEPSAINTFEVLAALPSKVYQRTKVAVEGIGTTWAQVSEEIEAAWVRGLTNAITEAKNAAEAIKNIFKNMQKILLDVVFKNLIDGIKALFKEGVDSAKFFATSVEAAFLTLAITVIPKVLEAFGNLFKAITDGAEYTGDVIDREMLGVPDQATGGGRKGRTNVGEEELRRAYLEHLNKIPAALLTIIENTNKLSGRLRGLGEIGKLTFGALIAQGMTYIEALNAMKEPLTALFEKYEDAGRKIPKFLQPLADMMEKMKIKPEVFESLDAALAILDSLKNTAYLTEGAFNTLAISAKKFARTILDDVVGNLNVAMKTMDLTKDQINALLPIVAQFVSAAATFGLPIPKWMKSYVTEQLGVDWKEFKKSLIDPAVKTNTWLEKIFKKTQRTNDLLKELKKTLQKIGGFQHEGIAWKPQLAMVGERGPEAMVRLDKLARGESKFSGVLSAPTKIPPMNFYITAMDSQDVYRFMTTKGRDAIEHMFRANVRGITRELKDQIGKY